MVKYWKITLSLKRGKSAKYKKHMAYINKIYKPHFLSISQLTYFDLPRTKPIPHVEFIVMAHDGIHVLDDFIFHFAKVLVTGGASPYKWATIPRKQKKIREMIKKRQIKEKKIADKLRTSYKKRSRESKKLK